MFEKTSPSNTTFETAPSHVSSVEPLPASVDPLPASAGTGDLCSTHTVGSSLDPQDATWRAESVEEQTLSGMSTQASSSSHSRVQSPQRHEPAEQSLSVSHAVSQFVSPPTLWVFAPQPNIKNSANEASTLMRV
jgi:hypothetical protein